MPRIIANWDERALLLLGVLMTQSQHGYQINDFIENALCRVADMKKGPLRQLDRLHTAAWSTSRRAGRQSPRARSTPSPTPAGLFTPARANLRHRGTHLRRRHRPDVHQPPAPRRVDRRLEGRRQLDALIADQPMPRPTGKLNLDLAVDHVSPCAAPIAMARRAIAGSKPRQPCPKARAGPDRWAY